MYKYEQLAQRIDRLIQEGVYRPGEPVPSIRAASRKYGVSIPIVLQAYALLEKQGRIAARSRSGYYVTLPEPAFLSGSNLPDFFVIPSHFYGENMVIDIHKATQLPNIVPLGVGIPSVEILPSKPLNRIMVNLCRQDPTEGILNEFPPGNEALRSQLSKLASLWGGCFAPENILITAGATEAIHICLRAVAKAGDIILTESPTYFGILQIIEALGMIPLEIPAHPQTGIDIALMAEALSRYPVRACLLVPNFNNPLGALMPDKHKTRLYDILQDKNIPLIEDDVYGDIYFGSSRPKPVKAWDEKGLVLYCNSFSKAVAPGYRVGWIEPGRYYDAVRLHKFTASLATGNLPQAVMAEFLRTEAYERNLIHIRQAYAAQIRKMTEAVAAYFPPGVKVSKPQGGFLLWVELPNAVDSIQLQALALENNINIAPGLLFSAKEDYRHFIRLNCGYPWSDVFENAIKTLGLLCKKLLRAA